MRGVWRCSAACTSPTRRDQLTLPQPHACPPVLQNTAGEAAGADPGGPAGAKALLTDWLARIAVSSNAVYALLPSSVFARALEGLLAAGGEVQVGGWRHSGLC